jgi:DNA-directed RNA polymerase specialized sigma24 family protein
MIFVPWLAEEDEQLRKLALSGASLAEIAEQMQRNKSSVRNRASKLMIAIARDRNPMQKPGWKVKSVNHGGKQ